MPSYKTLELMKRILADGKPVAVTESVVSDVKRACGLDISPFVTVMPDYTADKPEEANDQALACMELLDGAELILPDNKTCKCAWGCGRTIQYRPHHPDWLTKVCLQCVADRPLHGHS